MAVAVSNQRVLEVHLENVRNGGSNQKSADTLGMKSGTFIQRVNGLRADLREDLKKAGVNAETAEKIVEKQIPIYKTRTREGSGSRQSLIAQMIANGLSEIAKADLDLGGSETPEAPEAPPAE